MGAMQPKNKLPQDWADAKWWSQLDEAGVVVARGLATAQRRTARLLGLLASVPLTFAVFLWALPGQNMLVHLASKPTDTFAWVMLAIALAISGFLGFIAHTAVEGGSGGFAAKRWLVLLNPLKDSPAQCAQALQLVQSHTEVAQFRDRVLEQGRELRIGDLLCMQWMQTWAKNSITPQKAKQLCQQLHKVPALEPLGQAGG